MEGDEKKTVPDEKKKKLIKHDPHLLGFMS